MLKYLSKKKAQSSLEYAILIIIVLGALLTIQVYIKRGLQGRLRQATDDIGEQFKVGDMNIRKTTKFWSHTNETSQQSETKSTLVDNEWTNVVENVHLIGNILEDYWGK